MSGIQWNVLLIPFINIKPLICYQRSTLIMEQINNSTSLNVNLEVIKYFIFFGVDTDEMLPDSCTRTIALISKWYDELK